jgi:hypothetical protein
MEANIKMNIPMNELVHYLARQNGCEQILIGTEYLALEPKVVNDELILTILVSDNGQPTSPGLTDLLKSEL